LSIEAVARRAGVAKTAVYRRWHSKLEMVLEVVAEVAGQNLSLPDTGSLRGDIQLALRLMAHALEHPLASQIIPDLLAEASRNAQMGAILQEALRTTQRDIGAKIVDPEVAGDLIVGPLYWRLTVARRPAPDDYLSTVADATAAALGRVSPDQDQVAADVRGDDRERAEHDVSA
jgi:AcrR family transcriptional regulator